MEYKFETIILVTNFNGMQHLHECFNSLTKQSYENFKIVLLDDCSTDDSVSYVRNNYPFIDIFSLNVNSGFAKIVNNGINYCIEKYGPSYIAILNNDIKADQFWLENCIKTIKSSDNNAAVASNMLFYHNSDTINSQGGKFTFNGYGFDINYNKKVNDILKVQRYVLASCWGATLIKVSLLEKIGNLDESYYAYFEDLDWGYRANLLGYKIIFEEKAIIYHKGSAFWKNFHYKKNCLCIKNSIYIILKHYELKNIFKSLSLMFFYYFVIYMFGYLINIKREDGEFKKIFNKKNFFFRLKYLTIPFYAFGWNIYKIKQIISLRKNIQVNRVVNDKEIFKLSN